MKAVIFDMDGVIVDTMDLHYKAGARVLKESGKDITADDLREFDATRVSEVFSKMLSNKTPAEIEGLVAKKYAYLLQKTKGIKPIPGFLEFFYRVRGKYKIGLVSSSYIDFLENILRELDIGKDFGAVVGGDSVAKGKPHPQGYLKAAKMLKVKPRDCLVVEDSINGIAAAKAAGMKCIAVTNTYGRNFLLDADLIVDSLADIDEKMIGGLFGP
ncbi:MAG TPA: HAD family phosphatase [Candidatus Diapherotrites archaeon]|uniref:HAD family phosphatase n=1 Tax=Candidatus Iainarchaeum sp. TaxID=3101447 RepID=A0A7J4J012_9ARCH|nr:HAD family phosphatase [Candidatus Diapherotrites archaeon]